MSHRVLVVSQPGGLPELVASLESEGVWVARCHDVVEACERCIRQDVDLVVASQTLAWLSGAMLHRLLRAELGEQAVPFLLAIEGESREQQFAARFAGLPRACIVGDAASLEGAVRRTLATLPPRGPSSLPPLQRDHLELRIARRLDRDASRSAMSAALRELARTATVQDLFAELVVLLRGILPYRCLAIYVEIEPAILLLHKSPTDGAATEQRVRDRLGVRIDVPTDAILDDSLQTGRSVSLATEEIELGPARIGRVLVALDEAWRDEDDDLLKLLAREVAGPLRTACLMGTTRRLDTIDPLTGLVARRAFVHELEQEAVRARRYSHATSLLLVDVDDLGALNDTSGRWAGDEVLKAVSRLLRTVARTTDVVARWSGDVFAALLPETAEAGARVMGERLRRTLAGSRIRLPSGQDVPVTVSVAVVSREGAWIPEEVVRVGEATLRYAKKEGGNRVDVADPSRPTDSQDTARSTDTEPPETIRQALDPLDSTGERGVI